MRVVGEIDDFYVIYTELVGFVFCFVLFIFFGVRGCFVQGRRFVEMGGVSPDMAMRNIRWTRS